MNKLRRLINRLICRVWGHRWGRYSSVIKLGLVFEGVNCERCGEFKIIHEWPEIDIFSPEPHSRLDFAKMEEEVRRKVLREPDVIVPSNKNVAGGCLDWAKYRQCGQTTTRFHLWFEEYQKLREEAGLPKLDVDKLNEEFDKTIDPYH